LDWSQIGAIAAEARQLVIVMSKDYSPGLKQLGLLRNELRQGPLNGFSINIGAARCCQDRHIRSNILHNPAPIAGRILLQHRYLRRVDEVYECASVASSSDNAHGDHTSDSRFQSGPWGGRRCLENSYAAAMP